MIAYLIGKVFIKKTKYLILLTNNTGYQVFVNEKTLTALTENQEAALHIHHHVKEDAEELYGFLNLPELELFKNLIAISGVGPKTAERIVVELKSKIGSLYKDSKDSWIQAAPKDVEVIEALLGLGYSRKEVMDVVRQIPDKLTETSDKIKGALKLLAK